jgi:predicted secreted protein
MTKIYSEDASGSTVELRVKDKFNISLPETTIGGYRWKLVESGVPVLKSEELEGTTSDPSVPGGRSSRSWRFSAQQLGSTQLRLQHLRSWETNSPSREFLLHVNVES